MKNRCFYPRFTSRIIFICLALVMAGFLSCDTEKKGKTFLVGFSQCTGRDSWRKTMLSEMKRELSFHENIEFIYADADGNSDTQIRQIQELAKQQIDLLIVSPNEVKPLTPIIEKVYDSGIPVVVVDRRTNSNKYTAANRRFGNMAGQQIYSQLFVRY